jgi:hypothetical protein
VSAALGPGARGKTRDAAGESPGAGDASRPGRSGTGQDRGKDRDGSDSAAAVADAHRREWAFVLAATARVAGDIDLAEECV